MEASEGQAPEVPAPAEQDGQGSTTESPAPPTPWTIEQRREAFARSLQQAVSQGWRIESQTDYQANLVKGHRTNHILHLILSIVTLGLWLIVWLIVALTNKEKRRVLTIDEYGRVTG